MCFAPSFTPSPSRSKTPDAPASSMWLHSATSVCQAALRCALGMGTGVALFSVFFLSCSCVGGKGLSAPSIVLRCSAPVPTCYARPAYKMGSAHRAADIRRQRARSDRTTVCMPCMLAALCARGRLSRLSRLSPLRNRVSPCRSSRCSVLRVFSLLCRCTVGGPEAFTCWRGGQFAHGQR